MIVPIVYGKVGRCSIKGTLVVEVKIFCIIASKNMY